MADDPIDDDDYVANLLKQDAKKAAQAYSRVGVSAYHASRPTTTQPLKPNKRFLHKLLRETDSHNKAQLAKEAAESRAKLRALDRKEEPERKSNRHRSRSPAHSDDEQRPSRHRRRSYRHSRDRTRSPSPKRTRNRSRDRSSRSKKSKSNQSPTRISTTKRHHHPSHSSKHYSSDSEDSVRHTRQRKKDKHSSSKKTRTRSRSPRQPHKPTEPTCINADIPSSSPTPGPEPIRIRGRGASKYASPDMHTSAEPDSDAEAYRARQAWARLGAQRMRDAGFTEEEVKRWESGGRMAAGERNEEDVKWSKPGERREWDRGKMVDGEGNVDVRAEWVGRLGD